MLLFLDYLIRAILTATIIMIFYASSVTSIKIGQFQISNYSFDIKRLTLNTDIMFKQYRPITIKWDFRAFIIDFPSIEFLSIRYSNFRDLLRLKDITVLYWASNIKFNVIPNGQDSGKLNIHSNNLLDGMLELEYNIHGHEIFFTKINKNKCTIIPLDYILNEDAKLIIKYNLKTAEINIASDKLNGHIIYMKQNDEKSNFIMHLTTNLERINGEIYSEISKDLISINCKLDSIELIKILVSVSRLIEMHKFNLNGEGGQPDIDIRIRSNINKAITNKLHNFILNCYLSDNALKELYCVGQLASNELIKATNTNFGPITITSNNGKELFKLFTPVQLISSGKIECILDWNKANKPWTLKTSDTCIPFLDTLNIKQIISPIRWIRMLIQNPNFIGSIAGYGFVRDRKIYFSKLTGVNDYYKLYMNGLIDLSKNTIDLNTLISSSHFLNSIGEASSIDILKDVIKINTTGNLNNPQTDIKMQPCSILATLFQPILI